MTPDQMHRVLTDHEVILVSHGFQTNYERGFTNGLAANGVRVTLISSDRTDHAGLATEVRSVNLRGSQEESRPPHLKLQNMIRYHAALASYVLRRRTAIVHLIGLIEPILLCGILEGIWFRLVCRKYVLTVHDLLPHGRHSKLNKILFGAAFRLPHCLVVHTERAREDLVARYGLTRAKIIVMEHGIETLDTVPMPPRLTGGGATLRLLFFGYVARYKGLDILLRAVSDLPLAFKLVIAGACKDRDYGKEIRSLIAASSHADAVTWIDRFLSEEEIQGHFRDADALVMPYRHIDQSGVLFQALRFGVPVVATRVGQLEKYVTSEVGEVCTPDDVKSLRTALIRLHQRRNVLSSGRIREIASSFEWTRTVLSLRAAYQ